MVERPVIERRFRRHVAQIRARFLARWSRDPEQALEGLIEDLGGLMHDAVSLDRVLAAQLAAGPERGRGSGHPKTQKGWRDVSTLSGRAT